MKVSAILLTLACIHAAARGGAQTITLAEKNAPVVKVLEEIKRQTGYDFFYNLKTLEAAGTVTVNIKNASVEQALDACFKNTGLTYSITDKVIVISKKEPSTNVNQPATRDQNPPIDITGRITNEHGEPLAGASVIIKRSGRGDIADAKGNFKLKDVNSDDIIIISFAGYKTQNIKVGSITNFTLVMEVATNDLDKVVVQAYGTTTQRFATGNIATVTSAEIERQPVMNPLTALQGKVPGLVIQQTSGYASAPFKVEIRGRSGINSNIPSEPLYIIDGVPLTILETQNGGNYASGSAGFLQNGIGNPAGGQSPFFSINPSDIESITVLKDADATAIYGSRGANGVILITTKTGKAGKTNLELNAYSGISEITRHYSMLNTPQYLAMRHEAFANDGITPDAGNAYDLLSWDTTRYFNWQKYLWGIGKTNDAQLSFSGGDKQTTFRVGAAYHHETGILTQSGADQRASIQFNLSHRSFDQKFNLSFTSTYSYTRSDLVGFPNVVTLPPNAPSVFDAEGHLNWAGWSTASYAYPFGSLFQPYTAKTGFLNSQLSFRYAISKGLNFSARVGYSTSHGSQMFLQPIASQNPQSLPTGTADFGNNNINNFIAEPELHYKTVISEGKLEAFIGGSLQTVSEDGNHITGIGYVNDNLLRSVGNAPQKTASDVFANYKYAALFGRINYNWRDKYIINVSARRDGSSRFGPGKQFGNFGAVGASWIFSEESWIKRALHFLSFGKVRMSYGLTGSDNIGDYQFLTQWSGAAIPSYQQGPPSYLPLLHANPTLQWQTNKKLEAALNLGFIKDRLNFEVSWYRNRVGNQLITYPLPSLTGFPFVTANLPATVQNTGIEGIISAKIIDQKDVELSANFNIGINRNKLVAFPNISQTSYASQYVVGKPLNIKKLLHYTGVDPNTGLYTFLDKKHDGNIVINSNDTTNDLFDNDLSVNYDGGFGTDLRYKAFQVNLFFHFRRQKLPSAIATGYPGTISNQSTQILNRWQRSGDNAKYARFTTQGGDTDNDFYGFSDGPYSNVLYLRLQNVSISYDLPGKWIRRAHLQSTKVFVRAQNLFLITRYNGIDPETPNFGQLPPSKVFVGGVQFNL